MRIKVRKYAKVLIGTVVKVFMKEEIMDRLSQPENLLDGDMGNCAPCRDRTYDLGNLGAVVLIWVVILSSGKAFASIPQINLQVIAQIESSGNPGAIGDKGKALGLYQIHAVVVDEYNRFNKTSYAHKDALDRTISSKVADWYFHERIPQLLKHFKKPINTNNLILAYNAGIKAVIDGRMPKTTKDYLKKYSALMGVDRADTSVSRSSHYQNTQAPHVLR